MNKGITQYKPLPLPRRKCGVRDRWFELIDIINEHDVEHAAKWQEKGSRSVSGYAVMNHKGNLLPSTFSVRSATAKKKLLEPQLQRFNGIIPHLWSAWEKKGYKLVKIKWEVE